jgi:hypothetical protein
LQPPYRHHLVSGQRFGSRLGNGHRRDRIAQSVERFEYTVAFASGRMLYMIDEIRDVTGTQPVPLNVLQIPLIPRKRRKSRQIARSQKSPSSICAPSLGLRAEATEQKIMEAATGG